MKLHDKQYVPSPSERVRKRPVVILTTTGATSGNIRKTPVIRIELNGTYVAVASFAGAPSHPAWYRNLIANPEVRLQDGAQVHRLRAREVFGEEKAEAWKLADSRWPHFPEYRAKAGREIPVLLLEPAKP